MREDERRNQLGALDVLEKLLRAEIHRRHVQNQYQYDVLSRRKYFLEGRWRQTLFHREDVRLVFVEELQQHIEQEQGAVRADDLRLGELPIEDAILRCCSG